MSKLWVSAGLKIRDEFDVSEVKEALLKIVLPTNAEPGCHFFKVLQDNENDRRLTLWECWDDEAALQTHYAEPHTQAYLQKGYTDIVYVEKLTQQSAGV